jgi:hypothetical protein
MARTVDLVRRLQLPLLGIADKTADMVKPTRMTQSEVERPNLL